MIASSYLIQVKEEIQLLLNPNYRLQVRNIILIKPKLFVEILIFQKQEDQGAKLAGLGNLKEEDEKKK